MNIDLSRLGREPAVLSAAVALVAQLGSALFLNLTPDAQGALNAVVIALAGIATAWGTSAEKLLPAMLGFAQAGLALALAFGAHLSADDQSTIMGFAAMVIGMFVRTQVYAKVNILSTGRHFLPEDDT